MKQRVDHLRLLARYNAWMNERLYATAMKLPDEELSADRGAFFGSILATLNHITMADSIWLKRFATHPDGLPALEPMLDYRVPGLDEGWPYADIRLLWQRRQMLDAMIPAWTENLHEENLDLPIAYTSRAGGTFTYEFFPLVAHCFNHQTHHRGQVTTLLAQAGLDIGDTDLIVIAPPFDA
ncbi:DinB family protein [Pinirhizobacter sp.]|uniref:DinB family protein n=1 Tax=Pinirhizobacter sp. TaxID=2950432 RepID=UPI002F3FABB4